MATCVQIPRILQRHCARKSQLRIDGNTVRSVLDQLKRDFPDLYHCICDETDTVRPHINLFVNNDILKDRSVLDNRLESGDVLSVFQAVSGG